MLKNPIESNRICRIELSKSLIEHIEFRRLHRHMQGIQVLVNAFGVLHLHLKIHHRTAAEHDFLKIFFESNRIEIKSKRSQEKRHGYTKKEFIDWYGGTEEWDAAMPQDSSLPNEYRTLSNELNRNRIERFAYRRCHLQPQILLWCL